MELAIKVLSWLVKARRTLTVRELQLAVSVDQGCTTFDDQSLPDKKTLLDVCAGLATIDAKTDTIRLAHYTVQEYLLENMIIPKDADLKLVIACTTFLSSDMFAEGACTSNSSLVQRYTSYPFLEYAARNLSSHLKLCDENVSKELVLRFLRSSGGVSAYLQALYSPKDYGYDSDHSCIGYWDNYHRTYCKAEIMLHAAATLGHCSAVRELLEDTQSTALDTRGAELMYLAKFWKHHALIQLLVEKGVNRTAAQTRQWTEMHVLLARPMRGQTEVATSRLNQYKLETEFHDNDQVTHITYRTDLAAREERVATKTTWVSKRKIGEGGFAAIWLEEEVGSGELRAVKKVSRNVAQDVRELEIMARVVDVRTCRPR